MALLVVITTTNRDKFSIVKNILEESEIKELQGSAYQSLESYPYYEPPKEVGTIHERARQKVESFFSYLKLEKKELPDLLVGVDDGVQLGNDSPINPHSQEITKDILSGTRIRVGDSVTVVRAFSFLLPKFSLERDSTMSLPLIYNPPSEKVDFQEGRYPLSHVLSAENHSLALSEESEAFTKELYKKSAQKMISVLNNLLKDAYLN
jgi:hypothetical protein